jgi:ATP-dependent DNA helicase RecQ
VVPNVSGGDFESYLPRFRLKSFRPGQREVIAAVLSGADCLCVMPTGGGKSLCYQLPALVLDGVTLVVSPLIALMKDQVDQLQALGLPATFVNSTLSMAEQYTRLEAMAEGRYRLVYVVPERFRSSRFLEAARRIRVKLLAVDEAHCISEWGHDFRPDYSRLGMFRRQLGSPTTIALTATATDAVRRDIVEQLHLRSPRTFVTGFARPNLFYEVRCPDSERQKGEMLLRFLRETPGSGIVYASTRKKTGEVAERIAEELGRSTVAYHAGLLPQERRRAQEAFMRGRVEIVVATTAFGMGIDKADVRFVVHYNLPGSLEAYYQEAGRAGRDGKPSRCLLLYNAADRYVQEYFIKSTYPEPDVVARVYDHLRGVRADPIELTQQEIKEQLGLSIASEGVGTCEQLLESAGVLERLVASENRAAVRLDSDLPTLVDLLPPRSKVRRRVLRAVEELVGARRHEMVHFHPYELCETSELDQASVTHALRELNNLDAVTYVPPFRGRAIRMVRRDVPFDRLEIDFDTLQRRKDAEYDKLNRVTYFAVSDRCRHQGILRYFGDRRTAPCGYCDNCRRDRPAGQGTGDARRAQATRTRTGLRRDRPIEQVTQDAPTVVDEKLLEVVRMVLSGVARTQIHLNVSCGKNLVAQMLCGSASARMRKLGLDTLTTFGLLKHLTQPEVAMLVDALVVTGHLEQVDVAPGRPVVQLTPRGSDVMKGKAELEAAPPVPPDLLWKIRGELPANRADASGAKVGSGRLTRATDSAGEPVEIAPMDAELLRALKQWRQRVASQAKLPPHYILSNATLEELARRCPTSSQALLAVKGIGPAKLGRYGDALLDLCGRHASQVANEPAAGSPSDRASHTGAPLPVPPTEGGPDEVPSRPEASGAGASLFESESTAAHPAGRPPQPHANGGMDEAMISMQESAAPQEVPDKLPPSKGFSSRVRPAARPSHYWTWRLLSAGFSVEECEAVRQIGREEILDHMLRAVEEGWPVRVEWCLSGELVAALSRTASLEEPVRSLLARLPPGTRYEEVQLFLKCRQRARGA